MEINILSLFDGMSCFQLALNRTGIKPTKYFASEVDKYAMQVTMANFPNTIQLGDVRNVKGSDLGFVHILGGGSPCQSFSFAGKRKGMSTKCEVEILSLSHYLELKSQNFEFEGQSYLFWEYIRILEEVRVINPNVKFLLENVLMGEKWQKILTRAIGINPIQINSALLSAQNRNRLYWTNIGAEQVGFFGDLECTIPQPKDKGITWGDVRERGVNAQSYYYTEKAMQWLGRVSQKKNKQLTVHSDSDKMQMLEASHCKKYSNQRFFGIVDLPEDSQTVGAMRGRYLIDGKRQDGNQLTKGLTKQYIEFRYDGKTNALTTVGKDNVIVPFTLPNRIPADEFFFRYITPLECERLQTVPDKEIFCIFTLCKEEIKNYVNVVDQNPKLLKLALSVENQELLEFVKPAKQNTKQKNLQTKYIALQNVDIPTKKQTKKSTNHNLQELNIIANNVEKNVMFNCQNQEEVFVIPNVFINITEERITHYGKEESLQKDSPYTIQMNGNNPLKLYGKEIMQLVKDVSVETMNPKDMNFIYTTLSGLNIKNTELMLAIFYLFAKNATIGFIQDTTNQESLSIQFRIKNGYTAHVSDTQRYKMLGNGWTVDVIAYILTFINK